MRPLAAVELFFERLIERPSARLFRPRLRPTHVQRRLERAMELGRRRSGTLVAVPDHYRVRIHPADLADLGDAEALAARLATDALTFARRHGYAVVARPTVALAPDAALRRGDVVVTARETDPHGMGPAGTPLTGAPGTAAPVPADGATRAFEVPVIHGPRATLVIRDPRGRERTVVTDGASLAIGRAVRDGLLLDDRRASRQHARLQARGGALILTDLDSTNGTFVNGSRIREIALGAGDRIHIGDTTIEVAALDDGRPDAIDATAATRQASD